MPQDTIDALSVELATRVYVDSVSYSNPLPPWIQLREFPYSRVARKVEQKISGFLAGTKSVGEAHQITVPYKSGVYRRWLVPSINEQIILHSCTASLGPALTSGGLGQHRVFSYQSNPNDTEFLNHQLEQWLAFQSETTRRLETSDFLLQLDLKQAFASIERRQFFDYLRGHTEDLAVVGLLETLLDGWMGNEGGLPLVNDSLFFLGSAYLDTVDRLIARHAGDNFIRFVDDYRIFGSSRAQLESLFESISRELDGAGFALNQQKIRLGSRAEYFRAAPPAGALLQEDEEQEYLGPLLFARVIDPDQLLRFIGIVVKDPDKFLTVRLGRLLLRELRKLRANAHSGSKVHKEFANGLAEDQALRGRIRRLVGDYSNVAKEEWRLIWLLYLVEDLLPNLTPESEEHSLIEVVAQNENLGPLASLWATRLHRLDNGLRGTADIYERQDANYLDEGLLLYGETTR